MVEKKRGAGKKEKEGRVVARGKRNVKGTASSLTPTKEKTDHFPLIGLAQLPSDEPRKALGIDGSGACRDPPSLSE